MLICCEKLKRVGVYSPCFVLDPQSSCIQVVTGWRFVRAEQVMAFGSPPWGGLLRWQLAKKIHLQSALIGPRSGCRRGSSRIKTAKRPVSFNGWQQGEAVLLALRGSRHGWIVEQEDWLCLPARHKGHHRHYFCRSAPRTPRIQRVPVQGMCASTALQVGVPPVLSLGNAGAVPRLCRSRGEGVAGG